MVKFAAAERNKLTGLCIGMFVCTAFVLVFQIVVLINDDYHGILLHGLWGSVLSIVAASLGLAAAKTVQYKCLLQSHKIMSLISGLLIIPTVVEMIMYFDWMRSYRRDDYVVLMNIFMLVLVAFMFASSGLICQWQTKKGLCCNGCCCDYVGEEEVAEPTTVTTQQIEGKVGHITPSQAFTQAPPSYPAGNLQVKVYKNYLTNSVIGQNPNFPTPQNVSTAIPTAPPYNAKLHYPVM
jgi:hypothetical protein